jgi:hypothetical protein
MLILKELKWWPGTESNRRRQPFQGCALPTELPGREFPVYQPLYAFCNSLKASPVARSMSACKLLP